MKDFYNEKLIDFYYGITKWFTRDWWEYLLEKPGYPGYTNWWKRFNCRRKGHPCGPWYFNVGGLEPDWQCKDCGDYLG